MGRDKQRTKTHVEPEAELNARALGALERQRARTHVIGKQVFYNPATSRPNADELAAGMDAELANLPSPISAAEGMWGYQHDTR